MKKAVSYIRISSDKQDNQRQIQDIENFCKKEDYKIVREAFSETKSGTIKKRPVVLEMLKYVDDNQIKYIIISEVSRLGRQNEIITIIEDLTAKKVCVIFLKENLYSLNIDGSINQTTALMINILAAMAKAEVETLSYRINSGKTFAIINKQHWHGTRNYPVGYQSVDKKLVINPSEVPTVKLIFSKYLDGWGAVKICNYLDSLKILTRSAINGKKINHKWDVGTLKQILRSKLYIGERLWDKKYYHVPDLRIIDDITFNKVQQRLKLRHNNSPAFSKTRKYEYLFDSRMIKCKVCDKYYYGEKRYNEYKCISGRNHKGCQNPAIKMNYIEHNILLYLLEHWSDLLSDDDNTQQDALKIELVLQQQEHDKTLQRLERINELYIDSKYSKSEHQLKTKQTTEVLEKIQQNISTIEDKMTTLDISTSVLKQEYNIKGESVELQATFSKEVLHKIIHSINVSMVDDKQSIEVLLVNRQSFTL
jgi:DNA invertase Pin-like site-specific DNA recombinase